MEPQERCADLVSEMYTLVFEQAYLHEVTNQVTDLHRDGRKAKNDPWPAGECRSVLTPWYEAGWVELIADAGAPTAFPDATWRGAATQTASYLVLAAADAGALLGEPSRWIAGTADGQVMLCRTDEGCSHEYDAWLALAQHPARG